VTSGHGSGSLNRTNNNQYFNFSPAPAPVFESAGCAAIPVWSACLAPPAAAPPATPAFDSDSAIIDSIASEDFDDFAMDCYGNDTHLDDDMLEGLL